jgi:hypothetical protein
MASIAIITSMGVPSGSLKTRFPIPAGVKIARFQRPTTTTLHSFGVKGIGLFQVFHSCSISVLQAKAMTGL